MSMRPAPPPASGSSSAATFRLPAYVYALSIWFPIFVTLAMIAAWFYIGDILPGHHYAP